MIGRQPEDHNGPPGMVRLPAILEGTEKAANASEQIEFAQLCVLKKRYAAAARLYADAFAMKPQLAEDPLPGHRYYAVCSAALAGRGRGDAEPDCPGTPRWRECRLDQNSRHQW